MAWYPALGIGCHAACRAPSLLLTRAMTRTKMHGYRFTVPQFRPRPSSHPFLPFLASQSFTLLPRMGPTQQLARQRYATASYRCCWKGVLQGFCQCGLLYTLRQTLRHTHSTLCFPESEERRAAHERRHFRLSQTSPLALNDDGGNL